MPLIADIGLPSVRDIASYNITVIDREKSKSDCLKPVSIAIVNLMPNKYETEMQLLRLLGNTPFNIDVEFMYPKTHKPKSVYPDYLKVYYKSLEDIRGRQYDGMIITGAPVEHLEFENVDYWEELKCLMDFSKNNVKSTMHICWAAQAGLYYHYGVPKYTLDKKIFGVFSHRVLNKKAPLFTGFDDEFLVPHSRYTEIRREDIDTVKGLEILAESKDSGIYIVASRNGSQIFVTGHSEYDSNTLGKEYHRDIAKGLNIEVPKNYFLNDDPSKEPVVKWRAHSNLLFFNWIYYYVMKTTDSI
ncbi:homoserine O-succinyltransferase [Fonticella tunisiensis]|uniref:Homoserine O-acetyltransferase n=1 Tax=Fonticella tunisiensis TaxID=1096341 RepID=A0A4R7KQR6_9CLOT|nr:homoserine O-succinyltransferase [Fonticella tunisiensis]TDT61056.1 homoserine O-succinyltransferase [Fonticella tunisiensis]